MTNMINEMPCAYVTLRVASGPTTFCWCTQWTTVGHNATVFVYDRIPTEREDTAKPQSEGDMQRDALCWRRVGSSLPPGCLWRLWRSHSARTEMFFADALERLIRACSEACLISCLEACLIVYWRACVRSARHSNAWELCLGDAYFGRSCVVQMMRLAEDHLCVCGRFHTNVDGLNLLV